MLEMLLGVGGGSQRTFFPESGPGNKELLAGTVQAGYFGEVTAAELFQGSEVDIDSGLTTGTLVSPTVTWLKFAYRGKFLFIAKKQIRSSVSWNDLYNAGLVYGERGNGKYIPASGGVDQLRYKFKDEGNTRWFLKYRLPYGFNQDPAATSDVSGSEWNDLIYRVVTGDASVIGRWDNIAPSLFSFNGTAISSSVVETDASNVSNTFYRGSTPIMAVAATVKSSGNSQAGWRPVLELFDASTFALDPINMAGAVDIPLAPDLRLTGILDNIVYNPNGVYKVPDVLQVVDFTSKESIEAAVRPTSVTYTISALKMPVINRETFTLAAEPAAVGYSISQLKAAAIVLSTF